MSRVVYIAAVMAVSMLLTGCGIKPNDVLAPDSSQNVRFPRAYPDPATDAQPGPVQK